MSLLILAITQAAQLRRLEVQLEDEEQDLLRRGAEAQEEEEVLRKELTTLTQQVSIYKNSVARFTLPTSQALTELDAWTIFNANRATRHVLDNQWGHRAVLTAQSIRMLLAEETGSRPELLVRCKVCPGDKVGLSINEKENALEVHPKTCQPFAILMSSPPRSACRLGSEEHRHWTPCEIS